MAVSRWDAVVVGGGPAGLACALWLARFRRSVCVFDTAEPRNEPAWAVHGYPGIVDPTPMELRGRIRQQARAAGAAFELDLVASIRGQKDRFRIRTASGQQHQARRVVLAYGLRDYLPDVPGIRMLLGSCVFHCVDCDGPRAEGRATAVIGHDPIAAGIALQLRYWTDSVTLLPNGSATELDQELRGRLQDEGVALKEGRLARLDAIDGMLRHVEFEDDSRIPCERIFFHLGSEPRCELARQLDCRHSPAGYIRVNRGQKTSIPGVYAIGDITGPPHLASTAAADGVRAALSLHRSLLPASWHL